MSDLSSFCLVAAYGVHNEALQHLASQSGQIVLTNDDPVIKRYQYCLLADENGLQLQPVNKKRGGALWVDFDAAVKKQRHQMGGIRQAVAKAVGCKPGFRPRVLDATAGFGSDAFVLAGLGCKVTLLEKHALVYALLSDGLHRALNNTGEAGRIIADNMQLLPRQSAVGYLPACGQVWDTVYLDPMFPERKKTASVKKNMQYLHELVGVAGEQEEEDLFVRAKACATKRVVVKRALRAPELALTPADVALSGKTVRYDVYFSHKPSC